MLAVILHMVLTISMLLPSTPAPPDYDPEGVAPPPPLCQSNVRCSLDVRPFVEDDCASPKLRTGIPSADGGHVSDNACEDRARRLLACIYNVFSNGVVNKRPATKIIDDIVVLVAAESSAENVHGEGRQGEVCGDVCTDATSSHGNAGHKWPTAASYFPMVDAEVRARKQLATVHCLLANDTVKEMEPRRTVAALAVIVTTDPPPEMHLKIQMGSFLFKE